MMRATRLHPRTPYWCSAAVGASQVSSRHCSRPNSPPSRRDRCQDCALPGRLPSTPARHPAEPVLRVRGQVFLWGESVCPMLPWRQLFLKALVESPEGSSWVGAGAEVLLGWESRGKTPSSSNTGSFVVADTQPWTNLWWRSLHPSCLVASQCVGFFW